MLSSNSFSTHEYFICITTAHCVIFHHIYICQWIEWNSMVEVSKSALGSFFLQICTRITIPIISCLLRVLQRAHSSLFFYPSSWFRRAVCEQHGKLNFLPKLKLNNFFCYVNPLRPVSMRSISNCYNTSKKIAPLYVFQYACMHSRKPY